MQILISRQDIKEYPLIVPLMPEHLFADNVLFLIAWQITKKNRLNKAFGEEKFVVI